tara:strand:+ start:287 stop:1459 length:1173 start_codon:yes stop_codon:yes gene_type:complete
MTILGFNPQHHGSVCLLQDGELKYFIQEERLTRVKYDSIPFKTFIDTIEKFNLKDIHLAWAPPSFTYKTNDLEDTSYFVELASKLLPKNSTWEYTDYREEHHLAHVAHTFYNSGFKKSIGVIIDGLGSVLFDKKDHRFLGQETETMYVCSYPNNFKIIYKNLFNQYLKLDYPPYQITNNVTLSRAYEAVTMHLGFLRNEAGKVMGLSSYGKSNFPSFFSGTNVNSNFMYVDSTKPNIYSELKELPEVFIDTEKNPQLIPPSSREWHKDETKVTDLEKDLAWQIQEETQQLVGNYIEEALQTTGLNQVCCGGGYFLNCVTNYYLKKRFPNVEFYFEPIANDAGTAIGAAKLVWHSKTQDTTIRPFKSLYLGKGYSKDQLIDGIKKFNTNDI